MDLGQVLGHTIYLLGHVYCTCELGELPDFLEIPGEMFRMISLK